MQGHHQQYYGNELDNSTHIFACSLQLFPSIFVDIYNLQTLYPTSLIHFPVHSNWMLMWCHIFYLGFWIGGFGLGESIEERPALLHAVTVKRFVHLINGLCT